MIKIIQSLGLDYSPAIKSTEDFQKSIAVLNKFLADLKSSAIQTAKEVNNAFSLQSVYKNVKSILNQIEKENKPVEIKVVTDKSEKALIDFARSLGIKLDKELKGQIKGLAGTFTENFDESRFKELATSIAESYQKAVEAYNKKSYIKEFANSEDMKIYEYLRTVTLKLSETTIQAKRNVDGFSNAIKNLVNQSKEAGMELDEIAAELKSMGITGLGANTEDIAQRLTEAINKVREVKHGFIDLKTNVPKTEIESFVQDSLMNLIITLAKIEQESKKASGSLNQMGDIKPEPLKNVTVSVDEINNTLKNIGVVNKKVWKDASGDVYKYTETLKDLKNGLTIIDTYVKNELGTFDYLGRTIDDKSVEVAYKEIQKAHEEALKINEAIDNAIAKNRQMAKDAAWKQYFQNITRTSDELKQLNEWYVSLGGKQSKLFSEIEVAQMKAKAASIEQRLYSRGLTDEYYKQAGTLREQLAVIQSRLQAEGKLTDEEMLQTIELEKQLKLLEAQASEAISDSKKKQSTGFGEEMDRRFGWFLSGKIFYGAINAAKEARETIKAVEMGMTEIARVMEDSSFVLEDYRDELFQLAIQYGQTFENVQDIALRWAQAGYNVKDSIELTRTSLLALNTAELDAKNATESMIGIMAQWQLQAEDLALVMDKINLTADNYSITSQDLVDGLLRASSAAKVMNLSLDETIALLTVMREASGRTGQEVGNALNSILSYIQRPGSIKVLESMGIRLFADEAKTQFRNVMEIFQDIASKWDTASDTIKDGFVAAADEAGLFSEEMATALGLQEEWNDLQQRDIAQASAGVYRRNYFIGMIERMANAQNVLNGLLEAEGYSLAENARTMETLEKKQESLKASVEALAVALGEAGLNDALKALADGGTAAINAINDLPKSMKDLVLASTTTFMSVKTLQMGMKTFGIELPGISQLITSLTSGTWSLTAALKSAGAGISAFAKANAPLLALSAAVGIIVSITNAYKKWKEEQERAIEVFNHQKYVYNEVNKLIPAYEKLANKTSLTTEENEKLAEIKTKIIDLLPESKKFIENENISLKEQVDIIKDLNEVELERLKIAAQKTINDNASNYEKDKKRLEELTELYKQNYDEFTRLSRIQLEIMKGNQDAYLSPEDMEKLKALPGWLEETKKEIDKLTESTTAYESAIEILEKTLDDLTGTTKDSTNANNNFSDSISNISSFIMETYDSVSKAVDKYDLFTKALKELREEGRISKSTYEELIEVNKDFIEILGLEKNAAIALINAHRNKQKEVVESLIKEQEQIIKSAEVKLEAYSAEMMALEALIQKRKELATIDEQGEIILPNNKDVDPRNWANKSYLENVISEAKNKIAVLKGMAGFFDEVDNSYKSKEKKDDRKYLETIDAEIRAIKIKNDHLVETEKSLQEQLRLAKEISGIEGLNHQYRLTGELIKHNKLLLQSFKEEQDLIHAKANDIRKEYSKFDIDSWFDNNAEATVKYIEQFNKATKSQQEEMEKVFNIMQKLKKAWIETNNEAKNVVSTIAELERELAKQPDKVRGIINELIELEKRNAELDLELRERIAQNRLDNAKSKLEKRVSEIQNWIDELQTEIDEIQESERIRQESLERTKRLEEISKLQERYYYLQYKNLASITEEQAKLVGLEKEREQYLERQAKIQELQLKLENLRNQKTIRQYIQKEDGAWDYDYVADQKEIDNINKQIIELQKEQSKSLKDLREKTLEDLKDAQESYYEWERQNDIKRIIEAKQRRIKEYQEEIKDLQNKYDELERITNEAFARERENLNRYYMDIDKLTDERLKELHNTFGENWVNIYNTLVVFFNQIAYEYDILVQKLSTPLPTPAYSSGNQGFYIPSSSSIGSYSNISVDAAKYLIDQYIKDWWEADARGDEAAKKNAHEAAESIRKNTGLYDYGKTKEEVEAIRKKYGFSLGGETSKTGLHWIDGEIGKPERILSAQQTKDFNTMVASLPNLLKGIDTIADVVDKIESSFKNNIRYATSQSIHSSNRIIHNHIGQLVFPNVEKSDEIKQAILDLERIAIQYED